MIDLKRNELIEQIESTKALLEELDSCGVEASEPIKKIENALEMLKKEKLSIVLVGAFSDGKTSVISGWMNEKMENMKIASDESTDEILCYSPKSIPEGCQIVDTPGLFGNKEGEDEKGNALKLSDITRKFISEANLILYVVPAKNPIKNTHKECIRRILKELNKLETTVFVINKMDDVADVTDDDEFAEQANIKTKDLRSKLLDCGLSVEEAESVKVICISAAPDGKGIEAWEGYRDEYISRSHLSSLDNITNEIIAGYREQLITKAGVDVLDSEMKKMWKLTGDYESELNKIIIPRMEECLKRNETDLEDLKERLIGNRTEIKNELNALKKRKKERIRAASMEDFKDVLEDEVGTISGKEGSVLDEEINEIFSIYFKKNYGYTKETGEKFRTEYEKEGEYFEHLLKKGTGKAAAGLRAAGLLGKDVWKAGIFAGRDLLGKIGIAIKFKPWQVTKMASFATKAIPIIGAIVDFLGNLIGGIAAHERIKKFEAQKEKIKESIDEMFYEVSKELDLDEKYIEQFAPHFKFLEEDVRLEKKELEKLTEQNNNLHRWRKKVLDADYRLI